MKKWVGIILIAGVLTGCTTVEFVRKDLTPKKQALLRYTPQSNPKSAEKYRAKVHEQATSFCGGAFHITKEYESLEDSGSSTGIGTGLGFGMGGILIGGSNRNSQMYHFVEVSCDASDVGASAPSDAARP